MTDAPAPPAPADDGGADLLDRLLAGHPGPFALLRRAPASPTDRAAGPETLDVLFGDVHPVGRLAELPLPQTPPGPPGPAGPAGPPGPTDSGRHDLLAVIPYRQITERGFACHDDREPILAMSVREQGTLPVADAVDRIGDLPTSLADAGFDLDDDAYAATVRRVVAEEIGHGEGANFVIRRDFTATIPDYSTASALAVFRRLLLSEPTAHWTFLVHTGTRTFLGASPERHVTLTGDSVVMNPISGTYRYPTGGPELTGVLDFLADRKEADELYMVVDEELKMMTKVCRSRVRLVGPYLKEMARLAHTEYFLEGHGSVDVRQVLRETMFAPTVTGSPLENACRVIARHEPDGRGYYSGVLALAGRDAGGRRTLDSAILIRTADISPDGRLRLGIGASLVRESDPDSEAAETRAKAAGVLGAITGESAGGPSRPVPPARPARSGARPERRVTIRDHPDVRSALALRNARLSGFWLDTVPEPDLLAPELVGRRITVVDAEDRFTTMLGRQLAALGLTVTVVPFDHPFDPAHAELVVIGPGPGDPRDHAHRKIAALRRTSLRTIEAAVPMLSVCLGHQVLCDLLGLDLTRREVPHQGVQLEIDLFGRTELVGFYNSFAARCDTDQVYRAGLPGRIEVSRDRLTGEVRALRGPGIASVQFHPESVLTQNGSGIIRDLITGLLRHTPARPSTAAVGTGSGSG